MSISYCYAQSNDSDSMIIVKYKAKRLTDTVNISLPVSIRIMIIDYLIQQGLDPKSYFILGNYKKLIRGEDGYIELLKIGALRDLSYQQQSGNLKVGGAGGKGDDIWIIYDYDYMKVKRIANAE